MHILFLLVGIWMTGWSQDLYAAPATQTLADYRATYQKELTKIRTNNLPVLTADCNYLKALDDLAVEFKKQGDFDNTIALASERKRFDATRMVPDVLTNLSPAIAKIQSDYRAVLAQATTEQEKQIVKLNASYVKVLKALIKTYYVGHKSVCRSL